MAKRNYSFCETLQKCRVVGKTLRATDGTQVTWGNQCTGEYRTAGKKIYLRVFTPGSPSGEEKDVCLASFSGCLVHPRFCRIYTDGAREH